MGLALVYLLEANVIFSNNQMDINNFLSLSNPKLIIHSLEASHVLVCLQVIFPVNETRPEID